MQGPYSENIVLQDAANTAGNGIAAATGGVLSFLFEVTGTYTNITASFQASADGGVTYHALAVLPIAATDGQMVTSTTATGLYRLGDARGLTHVRTPIAVNVPTGTMTVRVLGVARQSQWLPEPPP